MDLVFLKSPTKNIYRSILIFTALAIIFAVVYTQSPLYTSNQNQYFLHGFADAGYGYLENDWLASTTETTPIFSLLIQLTIQFFQTSTVFYIYYATLLGIYLFSMLGIVTFVSDIYRSWTIFLLFTALLLTVHSAAFRFLLSQTLGDNWKYLLEDGLADQRLLGSVFQPSTFGVLLLLSVYLFLKQRPHWAVFLALLSASLHPTYLLSAGALVLSYMVITFRETRSPGKSILIGLLGLILVLPILIYAYINFAGTPAETTIQAQNILVNYRIPHHAKIGWWFDATALVKIAIILLAIYLVKNNRLFLILLIPFSIATILTILQVTSGNNALSLVFPWRISTFLVPLSTTLILAVILNFASDRYNAQFDKYKYLIIALSSVLIAVIVVIGAIRMYVDKNRKLLAVENKMMEYVRTSNTPEDIYFIPKKMQDFRLATGSPAYIEFKSIPYRDTDVLEWYERIQNVERFYKEKDCRILYELIEEGYVNRIVIPSDDSAPACDNLIPIYRDNDYGIYKLGNNRP